MIMTSLFRKDKLKFKDRQTDMMGTKNSIQENVTFRQLYNSLPERQAVKAPKAAFIERIAKVTCKSQKTVWGWLSGAYKPDPLTQKVIENELRIPATVLFPPEEAHV